jgi:hypothetical protein
MRNEPMRRIDLTGQKFGRLTVIIAVGSRNGRRLWQCRCECGRKLIVTGSNLRTGNSNSCGCFHRDRATERGRASKTHGHWTNGQASPTYRSWLAMHARCKHPNMNGFEFYGGRGIKVCIRWKRFENFLADMGERPDGQSLDRIDSDGNYEPSNCRWATAIEQRHNQRRHQT